LLSTLDIIKKASDQCGFSRVSFNDSNIPTDMSNVVVFLFFGDVKSTLLASSLLMKRYKEESKGSKYFILCSWPGHEGLFPYVDEYWELTNKSVYSSIYKDCSGLNNNSEAITGLKRLLNSHFFEVLDASSFNDYYNNGFKQEFFDRYKNIKRYLPSVPSSLILGNDFNKKISSFSRKVLIYPTYYINEWRNGKYHNEYVIDDFWHSLVDSLLESQIIPVIYQDYKTYDLSSKYYDKCIFLSNNNIINVLSGIRSTGMVLDLFNGISKYAIAARCPYLLCTERSSYNLTKEYEIDLLCGHEIPKENFYLFPSICHDSNKNNWKSALFDGIIIKLNDMFNKIENISLPSPIEVNDIVKYEIAKKQKINKMGVHFVKINKI